MGKKKAKKLTATELKKYKELLLAKRREILTVVNSMEENIFQGGGELSSMPVHMADIGTDSYEQEFSLGLIEEGKKNLVEIEQALKRIEDGTFGLCEGLGSPIEKKRLEAIPWTRYSLEYARMMEKGLGGPGSFKHRPIDIQREEEMDEREVEGEEDEEIGEETDLDAVSDEHEEPDDLEDEEFEP